MTESTDSQDTLVPAKAAGPEDRKVYSAISQRYFEDVANKLAPAVGESAEQPSAPAQALAALTAAEQARLIADAEKASALWLQELFELARMQPLLFRRWYKALRLRVWHNRHEHNKGQILTGSTHHATRQTGRELCRKAQAELSVQVPVLRALKALTDAPLADAPGVGRAGLVRAKAEKLGLLVLARVAIESPFMRQTIPSTNKQQRTLVLDLWENSRLPLPLPQWTAVVTELDVWGYGLKHLSSQFQRAQDLRARTRLRDKVLTLLQGQLSDEEEALLKRIL